jgi:hypothetical protein
MPTVFRVGQYRFFFYSEEGNEPRHIHIAAAEKRAKFWLTPVELNWNDGFRSGEIKNIGEIIAANLNLFTEAWYDFFADQ